MKYIYRFSRYLKKYRIEIFLLIYFTSFLFYMIAFKNNPFQAFYNSAALFALDIRVDTKNIIYWWQNIIYLLGMLSGTYTVLSIIELFTKEKMKEELKSKIIEDGNHIIVIGLGNSNRIYIDSETDNNIIVLEQNKNNQYLESYEERVGVVIGDARDDKLLKNLNLDFVKHIVISTGCDMSNLEIATQLLSIENDIKLFVHIEDRNLRHFHKDNGILSGKNIKVYSYHEEAARELFNMHDIDGSGTEVISSNIPYSIAVVGNTSLALEVIAQACIMGQLPNENQLIVYCIDKNINHFRENLELHFSEIGKVPNIELEYVELNFDTKTFYLDELWNTKMTNIILCLEDDQKNLDIASNLTNLTFLNKVVDKEMKTNILIAMFNGYKLSENIEQNSDIFNHLYVFGRISDINDKRYIIAGERDKQAVATDFIYESIGPKLIDYDKYQYSYYHYLIYEEYKTAEEKSKKSKNNAIIKRYEELSFLETDNKRWMNHSYFRKESNRAVADQMKMKLKYLGLEIVELDNDIMILFDTNKKIFDKYIKNHRIKLAKMEHNRWNTFHYLNGFNTIEFVSKKEKKKMKDLHEAKKVHMCLVEFNDFKNRSNELIELGYNEGEFEGYDFMINEHIPLILANAGYKINLRNN